MSIRSGNSKPLSIIQVKNENFGALTVACRFFFYPSQPAIGGLVPTLRERAIDPPPTWNPGGRRTVGGRNDIIPGGTDRGVTATLFLIRHAAHVELGRILSGRRRDVALSGEGLEQAEIVADLLAVAPLAAVYASPRERAYYTARAIAEPHGLKVEIADGLDEIDFGDWTGMGFDDLEGDPGWSEWNEARASARPPNGESMAEAVVRAAAALDAIAAAHDGATIACVSHCDIIRGLIARTLGLPLDNLLRFDIDPASVSRLALGNWGGRIMTVNERLYQ
jgi:broad specificity phosphatase PhoE